MRVSFEAPFPIFYTDHVERTADFYKGLGFDETYRFPPDGEPGFVALALDGAKLGIGTRPPHLADLASGLAGELCIYTSDVTRPWPRCERAASGSPRSRRTNRGANATPTWRTRTSARCISPCGSDAAQAREARPSVTQVMCCWS
jgi:hypothetical protein